ncbi:hypothetical protein [Fodinicola acaciae]|uniref:hypothetical protein n=1 Tax=Fodinicola acaciae TaxID=2681555 RepID=UPI0013D1F2E3|nr:hypothetical protein [Fodinicola acaciae]
MGGGGYKVNSNNLRSAAGVLDGQLKKDLQEIVTNLTNGSQIDAPGFGAAFSFLEAAYIQQMDYLIKNLSAGVSLFHQIGSNLTTAANNYDRVENVHVRGFSAGTKYHEDSYGDALGDTGIVRTATDIGSSVDPTTAIGVAGGLALEAQIAILAIMGVCSALEPTCIVAAIALGTCLARIDSIWSASDTILTASSTLTTDIVKRFDAQVVLARGGWEGDAVNKFTDWMNKVSAELTQAADSLKIIGTALRVFAGALVVLWLFLAKLALPLLTFLISLLPFKAFPPTTAEAEAASVEAGTATSATTSTSVGVVAGIAAAAGAVIQAVFSALSSFTLSDSGKQGVPDLQEFVISW